MLSIKPLDNCSVKYSFISVPVNVLYSWYLVHFDLSSIVQFLESYHVVFVILE